MIARVEFNAKTPCNKSVPKLLVLFANFCYFCSNVQTLPGHIAFVCPLASSFQRYIVYAGFELNHDYIAKSHCINRNRPWVHCNGHCYFVRKLKQAEENEKKTGRAG